MHSGTIAAGIAALVIVSSGAGASGQEAQAPERGSGVIRGHVTMAGRPVPDITVTLGRASRPDLVSVTDRHGTYSIEGIPPGDCWVRPIVPGYAIIGETEYVRIRLTGNEPPQQADFSLTPAGSISGSVLDADSSPIEGAWVLLYKLTPQNAVVPNRMIPTRRTTADGGYQFTDVQPGRYRIQVQPYFDPMAPLETRDFRSGLTYYYPAGTTLASARVLTVVPGQPLGGIDVRCDVPLPGASASGRVVDTETRASVPDVRLGFGTVEASGAGTLRDVTNLRADAQGRFTITGLKPGSYWVGVLNRESGPFYGRPVVFNVTRSGASGIEVPISRGVSLQGRVVFDPPDPVEPRPTITVIFRHNGIASGGLPSGGVIDGASQKTFPLSADGRFVLTGLPPGSGRVFLGMGGANYAVHVQQGGVDAPNGEVRATAGAPELLIVAASGDGSIRGYLRSPKGALLGSGQIEDVASFDSSNSTARFSRRVFATPDGGFVLDQLPPGDYTVMAVWHYDGRRSRRVGPVTPVYVGPGAAVDIEIDIDITERDSLDLDAGPTEGGQP